MSVADQKFRWLTFEQCFRWDARQGLYINRDLPGASVTPKELAADISYRCFQRMVRIKIDRARKRLTSTSA